MTDAKSPEPSIEEILASIRKIISDDEPEAENAARDEHSADDEVLELTNVVFDLPVDHQPSSVYQEPVAPPPPVLAPAPFPTPPASVQPLPPTARSELDGLASEETVAAASGAFAKLSHPAPAVTFAPVVASGGKSVEDIVRELLQPMLRQWIDQNLAAIVERSVERELRKISRKAEDS